MAKKPTIDEFRELMGQIHVLIQDSGDLTYEEGVFIVHGLQSEIDWVWKWMAHEAVIGVLAQHNERIEGELEMWRLKDRIEAVGWSPEDELEESDETP